MVKRDNQNPNPSFSICHHLFNFLANSIVVQGLKGVISSYLRIFSISNDDEVRTEPFMEQFYDQEVMLNGMNSQILVEVDVSSNGLKNFDPILKTEENRSRNVLISSGPKKSVSFLDEVVGNREIPKRRGVKMNPPRPLTPCLRAPSSNINVKSEEFIRRRKLALNLIVEPRD